MLQIRNILASVKKKNKQWVIETLQWICITVSQLLPDVQQIQRNIRNQVRHTPKTKAKCVALNNTFQHDLDKVHLCTTASR